MARSVEVSEDGLTYTFTLRDDVRWSNDPVTPRDVHCAWPRAMDPDTVSQYAHVLSDYIKGRAEFRAGKGSAEDAAIEAPDDKGDARAPDEGYNGGSWMQTVRRTFSL